MSNPVDPETASSSFSFFTSAFPGLLVASFSLVVSGVFGVFHWFNRQKSKNAATDLSIFDLKRDIEEVEQDVILFSEKSEKCIAERKAIENDNSRKFERIADQLTEILQRLSNIEGMLSKV